MDSGHHFETRKSNWQKMQRGLILQLYALMIMNSKFQLIKNVVKTEILLNEIKRMVFTEKDKLRKKNDMFSKYSEAEDIIFMIKIFKGENFLKLVRFSVSKNLYFTFI